MAWIILSSASIESGEQTVYISGGYDLSEALRGWSFDVGSYRAEIKKGTAADEYGDCTLTLVEPWRFDSITDEVATIVPLPSRLNEAIRQTEALNNYAIDINSQLKAFVYNDEDITVTLPDDTVITYASIRKSSRLFDELLTASSTTFSDIQTQADAALESAVAAQTVWEEFGGLEQLNANVETFKSEIQAYFDESNDTLKEQVLADIEAESEAAEDEKTAFLSNMIMSNTATSHRIKIPGVNKV